MIECIDSLMKWFGSTSVCLYRHSTIKSFRIDDRHVVTQHLSITFSKEEEYACR